MCLTDANQSGKPMRKIESPCVPKAYHSTLDRTEQMTEIMLDLSHGW